MYGIATGWLGMSHEQAMHTPIPCIMVTLKARVRWEEMKAGVNHDEKPADKIKASLLNYETQWKASAKGKRRRR